MASLVAKQLLDNVMIQSGIPYDMNEGVDRRYKLINSYLELTTEQEVPKATRKTIPAKDNSSSSSDDEREPVLKKA